MSGVIGLALILAVAAGARPSAGAATYPNSIAVLGHSGATGYDSDPKRPATDVFANSWATGTNPAVNSLYLRIRANNPTIQRHNFNLAQDGATVRKLVGQAQRVVSLRPIPELIVIQIMDADIVCPAKAADWAAFQKTFSQALTTIRRGAPQARIFVVSQFGSPGTYAKALTPAQRVAFGGSGPCDFLDRSGRLVAPRLALLERAIHGYEAQLALACKRVTTCRYDGGAFGRIIDQPQFISHDLNHLSIRGHAKASAVAWSAMKRAGLVPTG
jgi:hypothetical protein